MSENVDEDTDRRSVLRTAAMAGVPLLAGASGVASASTNHNHLGERWTDGGKLSLNVDAICLQLVGNASGKPALYARHSKGDRALLADGKVEVKGDLEVSGNKNFVQTVDTPDGPKEVAYTAVEADKAQTETTGVAQLDDGRAEIDLPKHFGLVTSEEGELIVQLTSYDIDSPQLAVTERSTDRIVVETAEPAETEFSYTVRGVREGFEGETEIEAASEETIADDTEEDE